MNKSRLFSGVVVFVALLLIVFVACSDDSESTSLQLCTMEIISLAPTDANDGEAAAELTTAGGSLGLHGRYFWMISSGTAQTTCPYTFPDDATPEPTPEAVETEYSSPYAIEAHVSDRKVEILDAYEVSRRIWYENLDGQNVYSDCDTCLTCLTCEGNGCGGCETDCMGCYQVVDLEVPPLTLADGQLSEDGEHLAVPVYLITGTGQTSTLTYEFLLSCADGQDDDGDGWVDGDDPGCNESSLSLSELDECDDGIDNDQDGSIDLDDEACAGNTRGQSETTTTEPSQCSNGLDDDGDGQIDAADSDCANGNDPSEAGEDQ